VSSADRNSLQPKQPLILASASPRRRELLLQIGLEFTVVTADIDETPLAGEDHRGYTLRLAGAKARAVLLLHPDAVVIGADTTVAVNGELLGKPRDAHDAARMLRLLRTRGHEVTTGIAVLTHDLTLTATETTEVFFSEMIADEIAAYVATGEPMDKAGAYAIQGRAAQWIPRIVGDYSNVVGLPLARLAELLDLVSPSS
jgi:septum formation protein